MCSAETAWSTILPQNSTVLLANLLAKKPLEAYGLYFREIRTIAPAVVRVYKGRVGRS